MKKFECLWYKKDEVFTKEFSTKQALFNFYKKIKNVKTYHDFWLTKRDSDWAVVEDYDLMEASI